VSCRLIRYIAISGYNRRTIDIHFISTLWKQCDLYRFALDSISLHGNIIKLLYSRNDLLANYIY